jgi:Zn-dependent protease
MSISTPNESQSVVLKLRLPLIWIGGVILVLGIYKTYSFHRKEQEMYAFLQRHPVDPEQAYYLRKAIGLHGDAVAWKLLGVGLALLVLGLFLQQILALFRRDSR